MEDITIKQAVDRLITEFNKDFEQGSYYHSWVSNIAVSIMDEIPTATHKQANDAAKRFLDLLMQP